MQSINIENTVNFLSKMLNSGIFDDFLFLEASIHTNISYNISGRPNKSYYSIDEYASLPEPKLLFWKDIKNTISSLVDYENTCQHNPRFTITLCLNPLQIEKLVALSDSTLTANDIQSLNLNLRLDNAKLVCTTATSLRIFTLDKSFEEYFDKYTTSFINRL